MIVGGGAQQASAEVTALAEKLCVGVIASNAGKGIVSDNHRLSLGGAIISPAVHEYLAQAEVVLAQGLLVANCARPDAPMRTTEKRLRADIVTGSGCHTRNFARSRCQSSRLVQPAEAPDRPLQGLCGGGKH